ncbi:MAG: YdcF family protein [Gemmatimonadales bacterium]
MKAPLRQRLGQAGLGAVAAAGLLYPLRALGVDSLIGMSFPAWHEALFIGGMIVGGLGLLRWLAGAAGAALVLLFLVELLAAPANWARRYIREDPLPAGPVDGIVVLSAAINTDGLINPPGLDRLREGIHLHRQGVSNRLILSSVSWDERPDVRSDADQRAIVAESGTTPELHIVPNVGSTRAEALRIAELAKPRGWTTIVVVTSPTHTRRACASFEAVGFRVVCRPSPDRTIAWGHLGAPDDRAAAFGLWLYESLGWWKYRASGWIRPDAS